MPIYQQFRYLHDIQQQAFLKLNLPLTLKTYLYVYRSRIGTSPALSQVVTDRGTIVSCIQNLKTFIYDKFLKIGVE
jgi:hypothetical protein